jgi:hypothetical protein
MALVKVQHPSLPIRADIADADLPAMSGRPEPVLQIQPVGDGLKVTMVTRPFGSEGPTSAAFWRDFCVVRRGWRADGPWRTQWKDSNSLADFAKVVELFDAAAIRPMRTTGGVGFVEALHRAHGWLDEVVADPGQSIEILSPAIAKAAVEGNASDSSCGSSVPSRPRGLRWDGFPEALASSDLPTCRGHGRISRPPSGSRLRPPTEANSDTCGAQPASVTRTATSKTLSHSPSGRPPPRGKQHRSAPTAPWISGKRTFRPETWVYFWLHSPTKGKIARADQAGRF